MYVSKNIIFKKTIHASILIIMDKYELWNSLGRTFDIYYEINKNKHNHKRRIYYYFWRVKSFAIIHVCFGLLYRENGRDILYNMPLMVFMGRVL